jgi:hypothetical protein
MAKQLENIQEEQFGKFEGNDLQGMASVRGVPTRRARLVRKQSKRAPTRTAMAKIMTWLSPSWNNPGLEEGSIRRGCGGYTVCCGEYLQSFFSR